MNNRIQSQALIISQLKSQVEALEKNHTANRKLLIQLRDEIVLKRRSYSIIKLSDLQETLDLFINVFDKPPK